MSMITKVNSVAWGLYTKPGPIFKKLEIAQINIFIDLFYFNNYGELFLQSRS